MDEEHAEIPIPALGDAEQGRFPSRGMLTGHEPEPGGELATILAGGRIPDGRDQGCRRQGTNTRQLRQPWTRVSALAYRLHLGVCGRDPLIQGLEFLRQGLQPLPCGGRQAMLRIFEDKGQCVPYL